MSSFDVVAKVEVRVRDLMLNVGRGRFERDDWIEVDSMDSIIPGDDLDTIGVDVEVRIEPRRLKRFRAIIRNIHVKNYIFYITCIDRNTYLHLKKHFWIFFFGLKVRGS